MYSFAFSYVERYRSEKDNPSRRCTVWMECLVRSAHADHCFLLRCAQPWAPRWIISNHKEWERSRHQELRDAWKHITEPRAVAAFRSRVHLLRLFLNLDAQILARFCFSHPQEGAFNCKGLAFCFSLLEAGWGKPGLFPTCGGSARRGHTAVWTPPVRPCLCCATPCGHCLCSCPPPASPGFQESSAAAG